MALSRALERHPTFLAGALYLAIALALTGPALLGRAALGPEIYLDWDPLYRTSPPPPYPNVGDLTPTTVDLPRDLAVARGLHAGRLDLWNPYSANGAPLWAEQGGPFFPLKAVFYAAPSRRSYELFLALRLVVAGLGSFLLARARGLSLVPGLFAGAAFELSGPMMAMLPFGAASAPYLAPWLVLAALKLADRRVLRPVAAAAVVLGIAGSSGHPGLVLMAFATFGIAFIGHATGLWRRPSEALGVGARAALAVVLGLMLAAPSLLPLAELTRVGSTYKDRRIGEQMQRQSLVSSRQSALEALLASAPLGTRPDVATAADLNAALGTLTLLLAAVGVVAARGIDRALVAVGLLGIVLTLAPPGIGFLAELPLLRLIKPTYAWSAVALPLAQAAGSGVRAIATAIVQRSRRGAGRSRAGLVAAAIATLAVAEQFATMRPVVLLPVSAALSQPPTPAVRFLQENLADGNARMTAIPNLVGYPLTTTSFAVADLRGQSGLAVLRYYDYVRAGGSGVYGMQDIPRAGSFLLDLAAVRHVVLPAPAPVTGPEAILLFSRKRPDPGDATRPIVYADDHVVIHENRNALPRVRIVHRAVAADTPEEALRATLTFGPSRRGARQLDPAEVVVLERDENGKSPPPASGPRSERETARLIAEDDPDRMRIEVRLDRPGIVVIADTYYPGWKARIDGQPTPIYPANAAFRAVHAPAGDHTIELSYEPASVYWGFVLAALASVVCAALINYTIILRTGRSTEVRR